MYLMEYGFISDPKVNKDNVNDYNRSKESQQEYSLSTLPTLDFQ